MLGSASRLAADLPGGATGARPRIGGWSSPARRRIASLARDAAAAGGAAALLSGAPSTVHALVRGGDPLEAALAAGTLVAPDEKRRARLLAAASVVHPMVSFGWALVLAAALPRRRTVAWSTLAGLGIAALDLGVVGRRFPRIRALPMLPQVADHLLYGATVGAVLAHRRSRKTRERPPGVATPHMEDPRARGGLR